MKRFSLLLLAIVALSAHATLVSISGSRLIAVGEDGGDPDPEPDPDAFLVWEEVDGATGYKIYWGTSDGPDYPNSVDVGNVTSASLDDLEGITSGTKYFNIRSYDESGLEGPWGEQIAVTVP